MGVSLIEGERQLTLVLHSGQLSVKNLLYTVSNVGTSISAYSQLTAVPDGNRLRSAETVTSIGGAWSHLP